MKDIARPNYPFNLELTSWLYGERGQSIAWDVGAFSPESTAKYELYAARAIGFLFLICVIYVENLRMRDIRISIGSCKSFLRIYIKGGDRPI